MLFNIKGDKMKKIELEGYGTISIDGISFRDKPSVSCDVNGNPLKHTIEGRGVSKYFDEKGNEVPNKEVCKKIVVNGDEKVIRKLSPTTKIKQSGIKVSEDKNNNSMKLACERKIYAVNTQSKEIRDLLDSGKSIEFPLVVGSGFKVWRGVLNKHITTNGKEVIALFACRGNIDKAFEDYADEPIQLELDSLPEENSKNVQEVFDALGV